MTGAGDTHRFDRRPRDLPPTSIVAAFAFVACCLGCGAPASKTSASTAGGTSPRTAPAPAPSAPEDKTALECKQLVTVVESAMAPVLSGPKVNFSQAPKDDVAWAERKAALIRVREAMFKGAHDIATSRDKLQDEELRRFASSYSEALTALHVVFADMIVGANIRASGLYLSAFRRGKPWSDQLDITDLQIAVRCKGDEKARVKLAALEKQRAEGEAQRKAAAYSDTIAACVAALSSTPCEARAQALEDDQKRSCADDCKKAIFAAEEKLRVDSVKACTDSYVEAKGAKPPACKVEHKGLGADNDVLRRITGECNVTCKADAPKALADARRQAQEAAQAQARARAEEQAQLARNGDKCRRCFLSPASASAGIESWCDAKVSTSEYQSFIGPLCNSDCANQVAYRRCLSR